MPLNPDSDIEITAFRWVPPLAAGLVRDLRARWALEEAGLDYRVRLLDFQDMPADYVREQPFNQVPAFRDSSVRIFETGAIVQYVGERCEEILPRDTQARFRAIQWVCAALNSVEPAVMNLAIIDLFHAEDEWAKLRRAEAEAFVKLRLKRLSDWLGDRDWLENRFTIGDLMMVTVLRILRHTQVVAEHPNLAAYVVRGEARPAFQQALADQLAAFAENEPKGEAA